MELLTRLQQAASRKISLNSEHFSDPVFSLCQPVPLTQSDKPTLTALQNITLHLSYPYTKL